MYIKPIGILAHRFICMVLIFALPLTCLTPSASAQTKTARIGVLVLDEAPWKLPNISIFGPKLAEHGWKEGKNLFIEVRYARGKELSYTESAEELVKLKVDAIYASGAPAGRAAFTATKTIPIVMVDFTNDPVAAGYADSYNRPGKNVTGVFLDAPEFAGKWVDMLRTVVPRLKQIAVVWDPKPGRTHLEAVQRVSKSVGLRTQVFEVANLDDIAKAFQSMRGKSQAMIILPSPMSYSFAEQIAELTRKFKVSATSIFKKFAQQGGLISYGPNSTETTQRSAALLGRILDGTPPGLLPIERPYRYDFLINMKAVKALNLKVPDYLLLGAELVN